MWEILGGFATFNHFCVFSDLLRPPVAARLAFFDIAEGYYTDAAQFTVIFSVPLNFLPWLVASKRAGNMMRNNSLKKAMGCLAAKAMQDESGLQRWIRKNTGQMRA